MAFKKFSRTVRVRLKIYGQRSWCTASRLFNRGRFKVLRLLERLKTRQEQRLVRKLDLRILKVFEKPEVSAFLEVINYKSLFGAFGGFSSLFVLFISLITSPSKKTIFFDRTFFIITPATTIDYCVAETGYLADKTGPLASMLGS